MAIKYYGDRITDNIIKLPNGGIVCKNVPIGRTGRMQYMGRELGLTDQRYAELVTVTRDEAEVFDEATLASFEGLPVTDDHPPEDVIATNYATYARGHTQNVRRGTGKHSDKIVADLFINDAVLADKVLNRIKREVSSGYSCRYAPTTNPTLFNQRQMRGNHVAVVAKGRAGHSVSIQDSKPELIKQRERRQPPMNPTLEKIKSVMSLAVRSAKDAQTVDEEQRVIDDAVIALDSLAVPADKPVYTAAAEAGAKAAEVAAAAYNSQDAANAQLLEGINALTKTVDALTKAMDVSEKEKEKERAIGREEEKRQEESKAKDENGVSIIENAASTKGVSLDNLVAKLTGDAQVFDAGDKSKDEDQAKQEKEKTAKAETMDAFVSNPLAQDAAAALSMGYGVQMVQESTQPASDSKQVIANLINMIKPGVASIRDADDRRKVIDAIVTATASYTQDSSNERSPYSGVLNVATNAAKAQDTAVNAGAFNIDEYQNAYDQFNPHVMAKKGVAK